MQVKIEINKTNFERYLGVLGGMPRSALDVGANALYGFLIDYHSRTDWKESRWFPGPRSGEFQRSVVQGWQRPTTSGNTIEIRNTFGLLGWKISGGTITPQRATHLTIPLIPAARHTSVAEFSSNSGTRLFRAGNALCRKIGSKLEAVYALSLGVKQNPYPDAMPGQREMEMVVAEAILDLVDRAR